MNPFVAEFLGTLVLILLGNGVVCNVVLPKTKGNGAGWIVITAGWAVAVFCGASIANAASRAHLNPALTIALWIAGKTGFIKAIEFIIAQMLGAIAGAALVYFFYKDHFDVCDSADDKLACFCNAPAIRNIGRSFFCEAVGTFVLVYVLLQAQTPSLDLKLDSVGASTEFGLGAIGLVPVALLVFGIGLSLGGTSGYAINPARDLGPRIAHQILPISGKRDGDWSYAWVPVLGPIVGGAVAALLHLSLG
jgi:glycerol uptake facilitator protein